MLRGNLECKRPPAHIHTHSAQELVQFLAAEGGKRSTAGGSDGRFQTTCLEEELYSESLRWYRQTLGELHPRTLCVINNVALLRQGKGDPGGVEERSMKTTKGKSKERLEMKLRQIRDGEDPKLRPQKSLAEIRADEGRKLRLQESLAAIRADEGRKLRLQESLAAIRAGDMPTTDCLDKPT